MKNNLEILTFAKSPLKNMEDLKLDVKSSAGRALLGTQTFSSDAKFLQNEFDKIEQTILLLRNHANDKIFAHVEHELSEIQNIGGTLQNLANTLILGDVELYEIKTFALVAENIREKIQNFNLVNLPELSTAIDILDPEHSRLATFYIYDTYSPELAALRKKMKTYDAEVPAELFNQATEIEDKIRTDLSKKLQPHAKNLQHALAQISYLDLLIAKAQQAVALGFCKPKIVEEETSYKDLFNPQINAALAKQGKKYQPVDVDFGNFPTLITGINMGGKTVLLRTLALSQYLCQFGFFVPAAKAEIALVDKIMICIDDEQNHLQGLSSFAAEMKNVNAVLAETETPKRLLVLIDELARTTNPAEGRAIVNAVLDMLAERKTRAFVTTHYDKIVSPCRRLRVRGIADTTTVAETKNIEQYIDYSLVEDSAATVPHEALRIAEMLGANAELIARAKKIMNED